MVVSASISGFETGACFVVVVVVADVDDDNDDDAKIALALALPPVGGSFWFLVNPNSCNTPTNAPLLLLARWIGVSPALFCRWILSGQASTNAETIPIRG